MLERPLVSILVVSFNTKALTLACLQSVFRETRLGYEVVVVDNASVDGSAEAIELEFPNVRLIKSAKNVGFGPANNLAAKEARGKYLLLLNSDTVVLDSAVDHLAAFSEEYPRALIWGGRTLFEDGTLNPTSCWRHMTLWSLFCYATGLTSIFRSNDIFNREGYGGWKRDEVREVGFVSGCFLLMTRELWDSLGGFDERFFMYAEETDLCQRAFAFGARPMMTPRATIIHHGGKSDVVREDKLVKLFAGRMTFAIKHWTARRSFLALCLMFLHCLIRAVAEHLRNSFGLSDAGKNSIPWTGLLKRRSEWMYGYPK